MSGVVSGTARELACLALGHDDGEAFACPATDEQLVRELTTEVQRLRVAAGEAVEDEPADDEAATTAVVHALDEAEARWLSTTDRARAAVAALRAAGWRLVSRP